MNQDQEIQDPELPIEQTAETRDFIESIAPEWDGREMNAWGVDRKNAALALGMRFGRMTASDIDAASTTGVYDGMAHDIVTFMFLSFSNDKTVRRALGASPSVIDDLKQKMYEWAKENNLDASNPKYQDAVDLFIKAVTSDIRNQVEPEGNGGGGSLGK